MLLVNISSNHLIVIIVSMALLLSVKETLNPY